MSEYEDICMICRRSESQAGKMFKMPGNMCVCSDCMRTTMDMVNSMGIDPNMFNGDMINPEKFNQDLFNGMNIFGGFPGANNTAKKAEEKKADTDEASDIEKVVDDVAEAIKKDDTTKNPEAVVDANVDLDGDDDKSESSEKKGKTPQVPRFSFINLADMGLDGFMPRQRVKKKKEGEHKPLIALEDIPAPHKIKEQLDQYVVGQEQAKKMMSVAVYNHYKRVATGTMDDIEIEKSNMLMIGPTGCGKTYLVRTLARLLNVPLAITDATSLTEAGYIGDDIESVVSKLLAAADNDVDKAEQGIIYIDEIDKIAKKETTRSRDVSGESVQQGMLKLLEGAEIEVPIGASSKNAMVPTTVVNTKNILFICGGAFPGLEEIIKQRLSKQTSIGFNAELKDKYDSEKNILKKVTVEDVRKFGMIPEFVGRLPMMFALESLTEEMLVNILKEPKNAIIKQYQKLLNLDEVELIFTDEALEAIAKKALERETGARALRAVLDDFMVDIMYEIPKDDNIGTVIITADYIEGKGGPTIKMRGTED